MNPRPRKYWIEEIVFRQWIVYKLLLKNQNQSKTRLLTIIKPDKIRRKSKLLALPNQKTPRTGIINDAMTKIINSRILYHTF